jgi:hypothetical protein
MTLFTKREVMIGLQIFWMWWNLSLLASAIPLSIAPFSKDDARLY